MKKLLAMTLALSICAAPFSAFAEEEVTAESLFAAMQEYSLSVQSMTVPVTLNLDAALTIASADAPETSIGISMTGGFDMKEILEPMQLAMTGDFKMAVLGQSEEIAMEMYMASSEDGSTFDNYMNMTAAGEESGWQHVTMDMNEMLEAMGISSMDELGSMSFEEILGGDITLDWAVEETDAEYVLATQLAFSDMMPLIEDALAVSGEEIAEEELLMVESILGSFVMNISYTLDKETKAALSAHVDFNDSDMTIVNQLVSMAMASSMASEDGTVPEMAIVLNDFSMDMAYTYDDVTEIVIPEEALAAETMDMNEMMTEVTAE